MTGATAIQASRGTGAPARRILIESDGERLLVDCGPDLREQLLSAEWSKSTA